MHWNWYLSDSPIVQESRDDPKRVLTLQMPDVFKIEFNFTNELGKLSDIVVRDFNNSPFGETLNQPPQQQLVDQSSLVLNLSHFHQDFEINYGPICQDHSLKISS